MVDIILQESHLFELREILDRKDGCEAAAYVLYGEAKIGLDPWERRTRRRFLSHKVLPIPEEDQISDGPLHVTWSTKSFVRLLKQAANENLVAGIVHTHPNGLALFSEQDNRNEAELAHLARNRNGDTGIMVSLLLAGSDLLASRLWLNPAVHVDCDSISVVGRQFSKYLRASETQETPEILARQILAFGKEVSNRLRRMKIAVVGCGGTGSATAMLLARLGVGQLLLIDDDIVEETNLNRLHGAKRTDADAMRPKVETLTREIVEMGVGVRPIPLRQWVGHLDCRDSLRSCDVVFGCTDDHDGRLFLNRFAFFYLVPVIDMGLKIDPRRGGGFAELSGRVTVLAPGAPCLLCRGVIDLATANEEGLKRANPAEYERRKQEAYVRGGGDPAPAVVTFTTETAIMAVNEFLQGITGFRGEGGWAWNRTRRFDILADRRPGAESAPTCSICTGREYWGRGDIKPFMDRVG
jgi:molybdopterin/thiamine biosynthesis adenylyltransferase